MAMPQTPVLLCAWRRRCWPDPTCSAGDTVAVRRGSGTCRAWLWCRESSTCPFPMRGPFGGGQIMEIVLDRIDIYGDLLNPFPSVASVRSELEGLRGRHLALVHSVNSQGTLDDDEASVHAVLSASCRWLPCASSRQHRGRLGEHDRAYGAADERYDRHPLQSCMGGKP